MDLSNIFKRVTVKDKAFLARQLATMLNSGLTLDKALKIIIAQVKNAYLKDVLENVLLDLEGGINFSEALKKHPKVFDRVFINIVVSGEAVGKLAEVLVRLADQLEKEHEFISKIKGALYYPAFIIVTMGVMAVVMMIKVIPPLKEVFDEFDSQLPWTTRTLIDISNFVAVNWLLSLIILIAVVVFAVYFFRTKQGKYILDYLAIHYTAQLGVEIYMARFSRTLSMLIQAGTPIIEAIDITSEVINNTIYQGVLKRVSAQVERGVPMSVQLEKSKDFPIIIPQMVAVGEKTGEMSHVLENLAVYYEEESDTKVKGLTSLFEPVIIVLIGIVVAFMVISIIGPIYNIAQIG